MNLRKTLMDELKNANKMLSQYETAIIEGKAKDSDMEYYKERVKFWSDQTIELRKQLMETRQEPDEK